MEDTMNEKTKELIAIGASISAHCFPCFDYHLEKAKSLEATEEEIADSINVGISVMNGANKKMLEKINDYKSSIKIDANACCTDN